MVTAAAEVLVLVVAPFCSCWCLVAYMRSIHCMCSWSAFLLVYCCRWVAWVTSHADHDMDRETEMPKEADALVVKSCS